MDKKEETIMQTSCMLSALDAIYIELGITDTEKKKKLQDTFAKAYGAAWGDWIMAKTQYGFQKGKDAKPQA